MRRTLRRRGTSYGISVRGGVLKILHSSLSLSRRGAGIFEAVRALTAQLARMREVRVEAIGPRDVETDESSSLWKCAIHPYSVRGPSAFGFSNEIQPLYANVSPDIVHVHGIWMYYSVANHRYCNSARIPYIVSPHGMLDSWALGRSRWKKRAVRLLFEDRHLRNAGCIHALCDAEVREIRKAGFTNPICVIPNGVEPLPTPTLAPPWDGVFETERPVLLFLGRLHPKKGLSAFIDAWQECRDAVEHSTWAMAVVGWDQSGHGDELKAKVASYGLERDIVFLGSKFGREKCAALRGASGFVLPSFSEGLPVAILEAWSAGLPVLMTPECNLPEGFNARAAIELSSSPELMAEGLREFLSLGTNSLKEIGQNGKRLVEQDYVWSRVGEQFLATYRWMLGEAEKPAFIV